MTDTDLIASGALITSFFTLYYTYSTDKKNKKNDLRKDKLIYLKDLTLIIRSIHFNSDTPSKEHAFDNLRDQLNYCSCFEESTTFDKSSEELDDNFYSLIHTQTDNEFLTIKEDLIASIEKLKKL